MSKLNSLIKKLQKDYPEVNFVSGEQFVFHPPNTVFYAKNSERPDLQVLHELGHCLNNDRDYSSDIALLRIESSAWATAQKIAEKYNIDWDEDFTQGRLDSYRDWLHNVSLCPDCKINGYQNNQYYHCPLCSKKWQRPNTAE